MIEVLLDIILFFVLSRAVLKLLSGVTAGMRTSNPRAPKPTDRGIHMARDPVCGTFVVPERAVVLADRRERVYFCSTTCRDQYTSRSTRPEPVEGRTA
jgi:YHS domain-containing protein